MSSIQFINNQTEQNDERQNTSQLNIKGPFAQNSSFHNYSPQSSQAKSNQNFTKTTPMSSKYKFESFSNLYTQQQQGNQNHSNKNTNSPHQTPSNSQLTIGHHRRLSQLSRNSQDQSSLPVSTPSNKQIKEYIAKNSITGLLGVKQNKKEIIDKKTLSKFSRIQQNIEKQDLTDKTYELFKQKRQNQTQKTQQSTISNNNNNVNVTNQDDSLLQDINNKKYKYLLDVEVHKADIFQKWVPQQRQQKLLSQNSTNFNNFHLNLSSLKPQQQNTQSSNAGQQMMNSSSSQNLSTKRKIKYFKENVDKRKEKVMIKENQKNLNKKLRKFGKFVEFSKVGPARSITCLQTRTDHLFNIAPSQSQIKLPLQIYTAGTPIGSDITQWKLSRPKSSNSFFVPQSVQRYSQERASQIVNKLNVQLERDTKEQVERHSYQIRSNLDTVVKNMRNINLNQLNTSINKTNVSICQQQNSLTTVNSPKLTLDFLSPRGVSASVSIASPQNIFNSKDFLSPQNGFSRNHYHSTNQRDIIKDRIKEDNLSSLQSPLATPLTSPQIYNSTNNLQQQQQNTNALQKKFASLQHTPNYSNEEFKHKRGNFISIGNATELILESANEQEVPSKKGSMSHRESKSPYRNKNIYSISSNNIEIKNQRFTQFELRSKINSLYEQRKENLKKQSKQPSISSQAAFSLYQQQKQLQTKKITQNMSINQQLDLQAMNKAIIELDDAEFENDKLMFDPNSERIKKKRRIKQKLRKLLIKCAKMNIKAKDINTISIFSTIPYENKGSFAFLECVKRGQNELVIQLLDKNIYYVSDFDQFHLTALHHACKKGNIFLARYLISKGADIDAKDTMGRTPLFYALIKENKQLIKELLFLKCSPWSGDQFTFLKQNLSSDLLRILQFMKELNIICLLQPNQLEREKIWNRQIEILKNL